MQIFKSVRQVPSTFPKGKERKAVQREASFHQLPETAPLPPGPSSSKVPEPWRNLGETRFLTLPTLPRATSPAEETWPCQQGAVLLHGPKHSVRAVHQATLAGNSVKESLDKHRPTSCCPTFLRDWSEAVLSPGGSRMSSSPGVRCGLGLGSCQSQLPPLFPTNYWLHKSTQIHKFKQLGLLKIQNFRNSSPSHNPSGDTVWETELSQLYTGWWCHQHTSGSKPRHSKNWDCTFPRRKYKRRP